MSLPCGLLITLRWTLRARLRCGVEAVPSGAALSYLPGQFGHATITADASPSARGPCAGLRRSGRGSYRERPYSGTSAYFFQLLTVCHRLMTMVVLRLLVF